MQTAALIFCPRKVAAFKSLLRNTSRFYGYTACQVTGQDSSAHCKESVVSH